jgi:hypothetical protein
MGIALVEEVLEHRSHGNQVGDFRAYGVELADGNHAAAPAPTAAAVCEAKEADAEMNSGAPKHGAPLFLLPFAP